MTTLIDEARTRAALPTPRMARAIREAAGVSQSGVARELGVARMTVCRWESGSSKPSGRHLAAYAELLAELEGTVKAGRR
ncbi:MAG: helix-turn-helix transcriptional regulator [Candidatus Nanopelagicales bacterium]